MAYLTTYLDDCMLIAFYNTLLTMADLKKNKNPFQHFWDMATEGMFGVGSDVELTPNEKAGTKRKKSVPQQNSSPTQNAKHTHIDSKNRKKAG